ncbi:MAG: CGNR zinc finger domain-containing protein [Actinomycetota bacterium]|nr:CGNR zinc finger domain-containing protein [Actinomycetota bacterium]
MEQGGDKARRLDGLSLKPAPEPLALVQSFVNTRNVMHGYDLLEDLDGASVWLSEHGFLGDGARPNEDDRRRLIACREGLRALLLAHNGEPGGEAGAEVLNEAASLAPLSVRFDSGGEPSLVPVAGAGGTIGGVMGSVLAAVVLGAAEDKWRRLKACRNEDCLWVFYDGSKNRSGSWCTMDVCGARAKMRTYRRRRSS